MKVKLRKSIRRFIWKCRPWKIAKEREQLIAQLLVKLTEQKTINKNMETALGRKRRALAELQAKYDNVIEEVRRQRCTKIKHASREAAAKAGHNLFNRTSQVMEPYECYVCQPQRPATNEKWWHIRHAVKAERGKNGKLEVYRDSPRA